MSTYHCPTDCQQRPSGLFTAVIARAQLQEAIARASVDPSAFVPTYFDAEDQSLLPDHVMLHCARCFASFGVHDTHCCKRHGCKYCDDDCPVQYSDAAGIFCEMCQEDEREYPYELQRITGLSVQEFEQLKADAQSWRLHRDSLSEVRPTL